MNAVLDLNDGLERRLLLPNATTDEPVPHGSVHVYREGHHYNHSILGDKLGRGIAAFRITPVDTRKASDQIFKELASHDTNCTVQICGPWMSAYEPQRPHTWMLIQGQAKSEYTPKNLARAELQVMRSVEHRWELGHRLADAIGAHVMNALDWPQYWVHDHHQGKKVIYRKGAIDVDSDSVHILTGRLNDRIWFYMVDKNKLPPLDTMPADTGFTGTQAENSNTVRRLVYVPSRVPNRNLVEEHPARKKPFDDIIGTMRDYIKTLGTAAILSHITPP